MNDELDAVLENNRKGPERDTCEIAAFIAQTDSDPVACVIKDISEDGAKLIVDLTLRLTARFQLLIPIAEDLNETRTCELRWRTESVAGVKFV